jgi:hypothetical protein
LHRLAGLRRLAVVAIAAALAASLGPAPSVQAALSGPAGWPDSAVAPMAGASADLSPDCVNDPDPVARADELLANAYLLRPHPIVTLPADPTWAENPLHDDNWQFQYNSLRYVLDLLAAAGLTGNVAYQDRAVFLLQDWAADNPRVGSPTVWSWNDHSTALRAVVLACTADLLGMTPWLQAALILHGQTLADPAFYVRVGNHALNQAVGLLEVGRVLGRADWVTLAGSRINTLIQASVDSQGMTNEQSMGYEYYNYLRYNLARQRMLTTGLAPSAAFARLDLMPKVLAMATLGNGELDMIGDTGRGGASIPGTWAEYAASQGASGPKPTATIARYNAGYLFVHSGWGERRAEVDETTLATKWGPAPIIHGHADGLELTLSAWGSRLLVDPGRYAYGSSPYRTFFKSRQAHDVVTVDGKTWPWSAPSWLLSYAQSSRYVDIRLRTTGYSGVTHTRRITYSRGLDYIIVEDRLTSTTYHTYRQLWHLPEDANPKIGVSSVWTQRPRGNVLIRQLLGAPQMRIVKGATSPIQGWISYTYGTKVAAPVEEAIQHGTSVKYITFILPAAGHPTATLSHFSPTSTGYTLTVTIGAHAERVTVSGASIWLASLY